MSRPHVAVALADDGTRAEILLRGVVGDDSGGTADSVARQLGPSITAIVVRINTLGGLFHEGIAIHNVLKAHPARVEVIVEGVAAGAGSVVAMAGDEIAMHRSSLMMIHGLGNGDANAERAFDAALIETYKARTGKSTTELAEMLATDTWMTAREAVAGGFADRIVTTGGWDAEAMANAVVKACSPPPRDLFSDVWRRVIGRRLPMT